MRVKRRYTYPETATAVNAFDPRPPRLAAALAQDVRYLTLCIELGDARVLVPVGDIQPTTVVYGRGAARAEGAHPHQTEYLTGREK